MAANDLTQQATELLQVNAPHVDLTQIAVEILSLSGVTVTPTTFSLQKLILSVKESNVPVRGRNQ